MSKRAKQFYEFGPFRLDPTERLLLRGGEPVPLTPKAFETLLVLVKNSGHILDKDELMKILWPDTIVEEANLTVNISILRKALGESPHAREYIETIPKRGYRFVADVREVWVEGADLILEEHTRSRVVVKEEESEREGERETERAGDKRRIFHFPTPLLRPRRWPLALAAVLVLALAVAGYFVRERLWPTEETLAERSTLAVLPFHVLTEPEEIGFLGIGIPDAIITRLANAGQLRVRPTSAILRYKGQTVDLQEVGRVLKTENVLTGTVLKTGDRFRVSVQLVQVRDGVPLWGEHYDVAQQDLLTLEDLVAEKVSAALKIQMTAAEQARVYRRYTENAAAYESYLRGRSYLVRYTKEGTLAAVEAFETALRLDPNYPLARAGLAMASAQMHLRFAGEAEVKTWGERAKREAQRALELDPNLAEAHLALAAIYRHTEFDWERTIEESHRALELNPNLDLPHFYRAVAFYHLGLLELAEREVGAGIEINPENRVEAARTRGLIALLSGRYAEAVPLLEEVQRLSEKPLSDSWLAQAYYYQGERARGEVMLEELRRSSSASAAARGQATLASFLAARGERAQAKRLLHAVTAGAYMDHHVAYSLGAAYAQLGQRDEALRWLRKAANIGFPCYPWYARDPLLLPLGSDPEFQHFLEELRKSWETAKARYALARG